MKDFQLHRRGCQNKKDIINIAPLAQDTPHKLYTCSFTLAPMAARLKVSIVTKKLFFRRTMPSRVRTRRAHPEAHPMLASTPMIAYRKRLVRSDFGSKQREIQAVLTPPSPQNGKIVHRSSMKLKCETFIAFLFHF